MSDDAAAFGRTIQIFLVDGSTSGLMIASLHGWTGAVLVATQSTFARLLSRPEVDRTGIYLLYGPDPDNALGMRAYIGEADYVRDRIKQSATKRGFWESAVVVTTSDEALTKGHIRYLEARLIEITKAAGRVSLENSQEPLSDRRRLPEADRANMEAFLANLKVVLPVIGLDLLKPRPAALAGRLVETSNHPKAVVSGQQGTSDVSQAFELKHKSGIVAKAVEDDGEFVVLSGSEARKDTKSAGHSYKKLKDELVARGVLAASSSGRTYEFVQPYSFRSPSAAAAVVLDRSSNGRLAWKTIETGLTYDQWQQGKGSIEGVPPPSEISAASEED